MTGLSNKLHAKAAAEKQQSITLVNQSFDERKIVVLRSDASDKTAKQNESDDHFRLAQKIHLECAGRERAPHIPVLSAIPK